MEITFNFAQFKVNGMDNAASVNIGTNVLIGISSQSKEIFGSGQNNGDDADFPTLGNFIDDRDLIDSPAIGQGTVDSIQVEPFYRTG